MTTSDKICDWCGCDLALVKAAPDLLAALRWFTSRSAPGMSEAEAAKVAWAFLDVARAAIAKAEQKLS